MPVAVRLFPLGPAHASMQETVECNLSMALSAIDEQQYQQTSFISVDAAQEVVEEVMGKYRTRQSLYRALLMPHLIDDRVFEVRGIHVQSLSDGIERQPQLAFTLDASGRIVDVAIVDHAARQEEREVLRRRFREMPDGEDRLAVLAIVEALEAAYRQDGASAINAALREELADALVVVSKLSDSGQASEKRYPAREYVDAFTRAVQTQRVPEVTFEQFRIYPQKEADGTVLPGRYHATFLQHFMFPPRGYLDTDYISLDVVLEDGGTIALRRAGRGSFTVISRPPVAAITGVDDRDVGLATPHDFINVSQQYHYVRVGGAWFNGTEVRVTPEQVVERDTIVVELSPKAGLVRIASMPLDAGLEMDGTPQPDYRSGELRTVPVGQLQPVPGQPDRRQVSLRLTHPFYAPAEHTVELVSADEPAEVNVVLERLRGTLDVGVDPAGSELLVDGNPVGLAPLTTSLEVTGNDRPPYQVSARNTACQPTSVEEECALMIPSLPVPATIDANAPTRIDISLSPLHVRNETTTGTLDADLTRDGEILVVRYTVGDREGKTRRYVVNFGMRDASGGMSPVSTQCIESDADCPGGSLSPGAYGFAWPMGDAPAGTPVLTLKRRRARWPYFLIPAAAGVVAAFVFPRTGSGGLDFLPPPRPQ
jgi:hypothetical protein